MCQKTAKDARSNPRRTPPEPTLLKLPSPGMLSSDASTHVTRPNILRAYST